MTRALLAETQPDPPPPDRLINPKRLGVVADIRRNGRARGWPETRVVEGIQIALNLSPLAAYRLWCNLDRQQAAASIMALASEAGVERPVTAADLHTWETGHAQVPVDLLDPVCQLYRTHPARIGYRDHSEG